MIKKTEKEAKINHGMKKIKCGEKDKLNLLKRILKKT